MKNLFLLPAFLILLAACKNKPAPTAADKPEPSADQAAGGNQKSLEAPPSTTFRDFEKTIHCSKINFDVKAKNGETSTIQVACDKLEVRPYNQEFLVQGQLKHAFGTDLNEDGFCELYLAVEKNDGSGNLDLIGIASFNDKSAGEITVRDVNLPRRKNSDKVYVHYEKLRREFYDEQGTLHIYDYSLSKGEAGFILQAMRLK